MPSVDAPGLDTPPDEGDRGELIAENWGVCVGRPMPSPAPV